MNITLKQLRAFVNVAEAGSFTEVARRMNVTQSAISLLIRELETELGMQVLDRSSRRTSLSAAGSEFYSSVQKVLLDLDLAIAKALDLQDKQRGHVRVACTLLYGSTFLPHVMAAHRERFPNVQLHIVDASNTQEVLSLVSSAAVDIGVAPQRPSPPDLDQFVLFKDEVYVACPKSHELCSRQTVSWSDVLRYPFVSLTPDFTARLQTDLQVESLTLHPSHSCAYLTTALGMVKAGYGIAASTASSIPLIEALGLSVVRVGKPTIYREVSLFTKRGLALSPPAEGFRAFLQDRSNAKDA